MRISFIRLLAVTFVGFFAFFINPGMANAETKIAIIPFSLDAEYPNQQIQIKITSMISDSLEQEGAKVLFSDTFRGVEKWDYNQFRKFGIESGVDYILTGSIFQAGQGISIDTKLINVYEQNNQSFYYTNAQNFKDLFSAVSKVSKEIIGEIFQQKVIIDIEITGNKRVEKDAIFRILDTRPGDIIKPENITKDLRRIYEMGYFDDVIVTETSHEKGFKIRFEVIEKPSVRHIKFKNNRVYEEKELSDTVDTRTGSILNIHKLNSDLSRLRSMYAEKNYHNCEITYEIILLEHSQADIVFTIAEGDKVKVEKITFEGNTHFSDKIIKKKLETSERGFFSFFTSFGDLNETEVKNDVIRIESLYKNNGFIDAKVSDPEINIGEEMITIHFKINEGRQYTVKNIDMSGDLIFPKNEILKELKLKKEALYNRENVRSDVIIITDMYLNKGFANVEVLPDVTKDDDTKQMDISYTIKKGAPVYFDRVMISGNLKTRDKIIRREIKIIEQGLYSKENIQKSYKNLTRLDYFSEIKIAPVKTEDENKMDLSVSVVEKETGIFSFGGGYSSDENAFGLISVEERNMFGRGQSGKVSMELSSGTFLFNIRFYEPHINDANIAGSINLYKEDKEFDYYDKKSLGMELGLGYKLFDYARIGIQYKLEDFNISDVDSTNSNMTPGSFLHSGIRPFIRYDSRNHIFLPTEGQKHEFSIEYGGEFLGGEIDFTKYLVETGVYFPIFWKFTGALHAEAGYLDDRTGGSIDLDYERFYLGGMNSVRGFDRYDIDGKQDGDSTTIGGEKYNQFNAELSWPLSEKFKINGVIFYDRGDVYRTNEDIDLGDQFSSAGFGVRWHSPVGPLRIEHGWVIDGKNVKESGDGQFEFSVGASF